jgi:hypothetical protein
MSEAATEMWSGEHPEKDGVYLSKFDRLDEDEDAQTYHLMGGKFYTPEGREYICWGGVWKRIGDLPRPTSDQP